MLLIDKKVIEEKILPERMYPIQRNASLKDSNKAMLKRAVVDKVVNYLLTHSKEVEVVDIKKVAGEDFHYSNCHSLHEYCEKQGYKLIKTKQ